MCKLKNFIKIKLDKKRRDVYNSKIKQEKNKGGVV